MFLDGETVEETDVPNVPRGCEWTGQSFDLGPKFEIREERPTAQHQQNTAPAPLHQPIRRTLSLLSLDTHNITKHITIKYCNTRFPNMCSRFTIHTSNGRQCTSKEWRYKIDLLG